MIFTSSSMKYPGYGDKFMGFGTNKVNFVGHGVGLELDEYPVLAEGRTMVLEEDMVIALEPKLIFPGEGIVGIENTYLITGVGLKNLHKLPMSILDLSK